MNPTTNHLGSSKSANVTNMTLWFSSLLPEATVVWEGLLIAQIVWLLFLFGYIAVDGQDPTSYHWRAQRSKTCNAKSQVGAVTRKVDFYARTQQFLPNSYSDPRPKRKGTIIFRFVSSFACISHSSLHEVPINSLQAESIYSTGQSSDIALSFCLCCCSCTYPP